MNKDELERQKQDQMSDRMYYQQRTAQARRMAVVQTTARRAVVAALNPTPADDSYLTGAVLFGPDTKERCAAWLLEQGLPLFRPVLRDVWGEVRRLIDRKAVHRSGMPLAKIDPMTCLAHASKELIELMNAPDDINEMADIMGCLVHFAIEKGWSENDLAKATLEKLGLRFTIPESKPDEELQEEEAGTGDRAGTSETG